MIFVQKLPSLEPEMRDALRGHIMRKRQRLKQELEQDAIERRLRREKELKQLQDAMTLDQIKEQLCSLEKRLEALKDEKHHLFVQLKQVLNEDNTRRKNNQEDQRKSQNTTEEAVPSASAITTATNNIPNAQIGPLNDYEKTLSNLSNRILQESSAAPAAFQTNNLKQLASPNERKHTPQQPRLALPNNTIQPQAEQYNSNAGSPFVRTSLSSSSLPIHQSYPMSLNLPRQSIDTRYSNSSSNTHTQLCRTPLTSGQPHAAELMAAAPAPPPQGLLDFSEPLPGLQATQQLRNNMPLLMDMPLSLANNHHHDMKLLGINANKRLLSGAGLYENQLGDERNNTLARKKPNNFMYSNSTNQFLLNSIPPHGTPASLSHQYSSLSQTNTASTHQSTSVGIPVPSPATNLIQSHHYFNHRKPLPPQQLATNYDYMMNQGKSGLMVPDLNSFYQTQAPLIPSSPLYQGASVDKDFKHFDVPYPSMSRQYNNLSQHNNPQLYSPENNPRYLAASMNYSRKQHQKNHPYQPKK